jgi:Protein of unknown function, DUF481
MMLLRTAIVFLILGVSSHSAWAQKTDVVTLANGDRITGEIVALDRGRLEFKTDDAGTLYFEWDKLASVVANRQLEMVTSDGRRFLGHLEQPADARSLRIVNLTGAVIVPMAEVTIIRQIGSGFWSQLDGSIDIGFSYTRSSGVAQLNLNSDTIYKKPAFRGRLLASLTQIEKDDGSGRDDRGTLEASYLYYRWTEWFVGGAARFETNESLGLVLRSQLGAVVGPRLINSNRGQMSMAAGMVVNDEQGVDVESSRNLEALFVFATSYYTYDRPKTNFDLAVQYYPSLSSPGRHRLQLDTGVKREIWKDLFVTLNLYNTYDSQPPNPDANTNDIGVVTSIGWSY